MRFIFVFVLFLFSTLSVKTQVFKQSLKGYWESGFWESSINKDADSTGTYVAKYPNGQIRWEGAYENGTPIGTWIHYYKNGQKSAEVNYNGRYKYWLKNNCLSRTGNYANGKRTGIWQELYYQDYKNCDSIIYSSEYNFSTKTETWYNYKKPNSEEKQFLDPYYFNKDLNRYYHRFTDINYGVFHVDLSLLNRSIFNNTEGVNDLQSTYAISQSLTLERITRRDIRVEYRGTTPNTFTEGSSEYGLKVNQLLLSFGGDIIGKDIIDIYPFIGFGAGNLQLDYKNSDTQANEMFQRWAGQVNLMLENRLNLKPYTSKWGVSIGAKVGYVLEAGGTGWSGDNTILNLTTNRLAGYYLLGTLGLYY